MGVVWHVLEHAAAFNYRRRIRHCGFSLMSTTAPLVSYELKDGIAQIVMDDGKVNVLSQRMFDELNRAFDRALADEAVVVLAGRAGVFSAGFDLNVLKAGGEAAATLMKSGFELAERILAFPAPVVVACTGHAFAMGVFLLLAGDYRVGAEGAFKIAANEVAIGLTMPRFAIEISRQRLTPASFNRAMILAETFSPAGAVSSGFLDQAVIAAEVLLVARGVATEFAKLNRAAHTTTKQRVRAQTLTAIRAAIEADDAEFRARLK